jgi:phytoene dehydrogenase-like protein
VATILIVGGGHNALVAATLLSREGHDVTLVEARPTLGGALGVESFHPGYRCPLQGGVGGALLPEVARSLGLERPARSGSPLTVLGQDGSAMVAESDRELRAIGRRLSDTDRVRFAELTHVVSRLARLLVPLLTAPPPSIAAPTFADLVSLASAGRRFRALGRRDGFRLLQWAPMPVADLAADWVEDPLLQAMVAARGIWGRMAGPRSAGTALEVLLHAARAGWVIASPAGPPVAVDAPLQALAAAADRSGVRVRTSAPVARVLVEDGRTAGVRLESGEEIAADLVVSGADPRRTFLLLVDARWLPPAFLGDVQKIRADGIVAKLHLALDRVPPFTALAGLPAAERDRLLAGRLQVGASPDDLERAFDAAKYGSYSDRPCMELTVPSLRDPGLAPAGHHVVSAVVQFAPRNLRGPSMGGDGRPSWDAVREAFAKTVVDRLEELAPGLRSSIVARQVVTPEDLERGYGLTGGHPHHGEHALDQLFVMRPVYAWANYRTPVRGLYLCGAGTHPGGGIHGACGLNAARTILRDLSDGRA